MKVFAYNPVTGKRGELLGNVKRHEWTDMSINYAMGSDQIEPMEFVTPEIKGQEWIAHVDAGYTETSYKRDQWICFCWGLESYSDVWIWAILPPKGEVKYIK